MGAELDIRHNPLRELLTSTTITAIELGIHQANEVSSHPTLLNS